MEKLIRFITPQYKTLFYIKDGGLIKVTGKDGRVFIQKCKYLDEYHVRIGYETYHICQYAELCERFGYVVVPDIDEREEEGVWKIGHYIFYIQKSITGAWDFSFYKEEYLELIDGGVYEDNLNLSEAREEIFKLYEDGYVLKELTDWEYLTRYPMDVSTFWDKLDAYNN